MGLGGVPEPSTKSMMTKIKLVELDTMAFTHTFTRVDASEDIQETMRN